MQVEHLVFFCFYESESSEPPHAHFSSGAVSTCSTYMGDPTNTSPVAAGMWSDLLKGLDQVFFVAPLNSIKCHSPESHKGKRIAMKCSRK